MNSTVQMAQSVVADPVATAMTTVTKNYELGLGLVQSSLLVQGLIGLFAIAAIGVAIYYRDKLSIGQYFEFLNYIPMKVVFVVGAACIVAFVIIMTFAFKQLIGNYMPLLYWILFPLLIFGVSITITLMNQMTTAHTTDIGLAASSCIKPVLAGMAGLVIGKSAYVRAPVASAFPILNSLKGIDDILEIERVTPAIEGMGVAYWVWWFLILSQTAALGEATIHPS